MSAWREFEQLGAQILAELSPTANVKWNDSVWGHDTEQFRQIDVTVRSSYEGIPLLTIVQARDRAVPADVNSVGEFASVVRDVRATQGILVCRSGFTAGAKRYARKIGIELVNLHDASSVEWNQHVRIPVLWVDYSPKVSPQWVVDLNAGESIRLDSHRFPILSSDDGTTVINPIRTFRKHWNARTIPTSPGGPHTLRDDRALKVLIGTRAAHEWRDVKFAVVYWVERNAWLGQFEPGRCRGIIDYIHDERFLASHLDLGSVPVERADAWIAIDDPDHIALTTPGTIVTSEAITILTGGSSVTTELSASPLDDSNWPAWLERS